MISLDPVNKFFGSGSTSTQAPVRLTSARDALCEPEPPRTRRARLELGIWSLELPWSLEIGAWSFSIPRHPIRHHIIPKRHLAPVESLKPLRVAIGEHHVLAFGVNLPEFRDRLIRRAAHAILRVIILVRIERIEMQRPTRNATRIPAEHECRRE